MKAVLISIQPKWVKKIASGEKTIEVRKTKPNLQTPFKCYIYMTKAKPYWFEFVGGGKMRARNGMVIGEFVCDEITQFGNNFFLPSMLWIEKEACLSGVEICKYLGEKESGFAWHISDLKIYDKPKELGGFNHDTILHTRFNGYKEPITRPPQSWCYVEELKELQGETKL